MNARISLFSHFHINASRNVKYLYILRIILIFSIFIKFPNQFPWCIDAIHFVIFDLESLHSRIPPVRGTNRFTVKNEQRTLEGQFFFPVKTEMPYFTNIEISDTAEISTVEEISTKHCHFSLYSDIWNFNVDRICN